MIFLQREDLRALGAAPEDGPLLDVSNKPTPSCATLPSSSAVADLLDRKPGAWQDVALSTGLRAGLIGIGLAVAGEREALIKKSLFAAVAIEAFVIWYVATHREKAGA